MSPPSKRRALGRGLSALLPDAAAPAPKKKSGRSQKVKEPPPARRKQYFQAAIEDVFPSPDQPRRRFEDVELDELAQSIRTYGVIQPLIVRTRDDGGYFLIAGERRWRASQRAGLERVPVVVQEVAAKEAFERALVENLQRSDLNPIEEAEAYRRLADEFGYTQEQVADRVGKDRSTVTNSLRLLRLPPKVRTMVEDGALSNGHAKALLALGSAGEIETAARAVALKRLSVRATEDLVKKQKRRAEDPNGDSSDKSKDASAGKSASVRDLEARLTRSLGARTQVLEDAKGKGGLLQIRYIDLDDLDRLLVKLLD